MAVDVLMPNLGFDTQVGRLIEWLKQVGETVQKGEAVAIVESDKATILDSLAKTNRLVIVEEAPHQAGWGGDIASLAADEGVYWLEAPVKRVNMGAALIAYSPPLEDEVIPNISRIIRAVQAVIAA
jgi:pyruvate/2-oxoglutarate/acetoin dehydrogenase E1 component